jgi:hypothetical protein
MIDQPKNVLTRQIFELTRMARVQGTCKNPNSDHSNHGLGLIMWSLQLVSKLVTTT